MVPPRPAGAPLRFTHATPSLMPARPDALSGARGRGRAAGVAGVRLASPVRGARTAPDHASPIEGEHAPSHPANPRSFSWAVGPMKMALLLCLLAAAQARAQAPAVVQGRVVGDSSGEGIAGALVEQLDGPRHAFSDSAGAYVLRGLDDGAHRIRFARFGYRPRALDVVVRGGRTLRLDVTLPRDPVALGPVPVGADREEEGEAGVGAAELGLRRYGAASLDRPLLPGGADALSPLEGLPDVRGGPTGLGALRIRGGSPDQNRILLDGAPLLGPFHGGGAFTAVDPDALYAVTLHEGVVPAELGGALSDVVELEILAPPDRLEVRGGANVFTARALVAGPLPDGIGGFLLSGQRGLRDAFAELQGETTTDSGVSDVLGKLAFPLGGGSLEALAFHSQDGIGFDAVADSLLGSEAPVPSAPASAGQRNRFAWRSTTAAVRWRRAWAHASVRASAWSATLGADLAWLNQRVGIERLRDRTHEMGAEAAAAFPLAGGRAEAGLAVRRLQAAYGVSDSARSRLSLAGTVALALAFVDERLATGRWSAMAGVRGTASPRLGVQLAPRVSLRYALTRHTSVGLGYGRMSQYTQSLRNEESVLSAVTGVSLPVVADGARVPLASGDEWTGALAADLAPGVRLGADAYLRRLDGLVLPALATAQPFVADSLVSGEGRARGLTLRLGVERGVFRVDAGYGLASSHRAGPANAYRLSLPGHTVAVAAGYRAGAATWLLAALRVADTRPSTDLLGGFVWTPDDPLDDVSQIAGSPQARTGPLNGALLPRYARLDVGLRHAWILELGGRRGRLEGYVAINNVLNRGNELARSVWVQGGQQRPLLLLPRSFEVGFSWEPGAGVSSAQVAESRD